MIPTMIAFGLVFGRWWRAALVAAAILWPVLLLTADGVVERSMGDLGVLVAAALLGLANAAVGVLVHQGVLLAIRRRGARHAPEPGPDDDGS